MRTPTTVAPIPANGTNLSTFSQADLDTIAAKLNNRPRKYLKFRTSAEHVALTG
jgi:IS30 family transposase